MNNYLTHYGVLGMRWGEHKKQSVRDNNRINNNIKKASSIASDSSKIVNELKKTNDSIGSAIRSGKKIKDLNKMTDQELRTKVNRMDLEKRYSDLTSNQRSRGQSYVGLVLDLAGSALTVTGSALAIALSIQQLKKRK